MLPRWSERRGQGRIVFAHGTSRNLDPIPKLYELSMRMSYPHIPSSFMALSGLLRNSTPDADQVNRFSCSLRETYPCATGQKKVVARKISGNVVAIDRLCLGPRARTAQRGIRQHHEAGTGVQDRRGQTLPRRPLEISAIIPPLSPPVVLFPGVPVACALSHFQGARRWTPSFCTGIANAR